MAGENTCTRDCLCVASLQHYAFCCWGHVKGDYRAAFKLKKQWPSFLKANSVYISSLQTSLSLQTLLASGQQPEKTKLNLWSISVVVCKNSCFVLCCCYLQLWGKRIRSRCLWKSVNARGRKVVRFHFKQQSILIWQYGKPFSFCSFLSKYPPNSSFKFSHHTFNYRLIKFLQVILWVTWINSIGADMRAVTISDFAYTIVFVKQIHNNNIIGTSIEIWKNKMYL